MHWVAGKPVIERIFDRLLDDALGFGGSETVFSLTLKFRLAHEDRQHATSAGHHVIACNGRGALFLADAFGVILQSAQ